MIVLTVNDKDLRFEHSLVSLSEWESEFEKPFYSSNDDETKTDEEMIKYFECMLISDIKYRYLVRLLDPDQTLALSVYIGKDRTATRVREMIEKRGPKVNVTSELIYYWMISFKIPFTPCDTWHLNRLLMLVKVCGAKSAADAPKTKQSQTQMAMSMRELNEQRLKESGSSG